MRRLFTASLRSLAATAEPHDFTLPVRSPEELLAEPARVVVIRQIKTLASATDDHFEQIYMGALKRWAAYVQELPASEAHHHAHQGGLLDHSLDVARRALLIRRQYMLPAGAPPEVTTRLADRWTFAAFAAALLHDVGKPATDQEIVLYSSDGENVGAWNPWSGPMPPGYRYFMQFRSTREYRNHETAGAFLAAQFLPPEAIEWLGQVTALMVTLIGALSHNDTGGGALSEIVSIADQQSAAVGLGGDGAQMPSARRRTLASAVRETIRTLIDSGEVPVNRPGAGGFVKDGTLWLVSKRALDRLRTKLRESGAADVPTRNDLFMDDLQAQGVITPNDEGRAIWRATVKSPDGEFDQELSFLKIPLASIWSGSPNTPQDYDGTVTPRDGKANDATAKRGTNPRAAENEPAIAKPAGPKRETKGDEEASAGNERRYALVSEKPNEKADRGAALRANTPDDATTDPTPPKEFSIEAEAFFDWLGRGIREGDLSVNNSKAQLHVVAEGLFMVSPLIFKAYAGDNGPWSAVQKKLIQAEQHIRTVKGQNILLYRVEGANMTSKLKGLVLKDPEAFLGVKLPKLNNRLMRMSEF